MRQDYGFRDETSGASAESFVFHRLGGSGTKKGEGAYRSEPVA